MAPFVCLIFVNTGPEGSEKEDCCLARLSIYNYVTKAFDALGMTLACNGYTIFEWLHSFRRAHEQVLESGA